MSQKLIDNTAPQHRLKSAEGVRRKKNLQRITEENRKILTRIQEIEPVYNRIRWDVESLQRQRAQK